MAAAVLTDGDRAAELGEGALRARWSVTDFAPRADRHDGRGVVRLDSVGVDHAIGVADVATESDGEVPLGGEVPEPAAVGSARHPEVCPAVGHLRDLGEDAPWARERLVDDPQRATAADSGEVKSGSGLSLRDVSGAIGSDEEEGNAALAVPLECGQPVADGLEADLELEAQQIDVVSQGLSGFQELGVRQ